MANGMLSKAAQNAANVPPPQPGPTGGAAPTPGGAPPGPPPAPAGAPGGPAMQQNVSGGAGPPPGTVMPGDTLEAPMAMPGAGAGPAYQGEDVEIPQEAATAAEQQEYERVVGAMQKILYEEDNLVDAVMQQLNPADKVSSTTKATTLFIQQVDERLDMDEIVIPQVTMDAVEMITELAEQRFGQEFSEQELQATLGSTWEGVMAMFGVDPQDYAQLTEGMTPEGLDALDKTRTGILAQAQPMPSQFAGPTGPQPTPPTGTAGPPQPMPTPAGGPMGG